MHSVICSECWNFTMLNFASTRSIVDNEHCVLANQWNNHVINDLCHFEELIFVLKGIISFVLGDYETKSNSLTEGRLQIKHFDVVQVLRRGSCLLSSYGNEYDVEETIGKQKFLIFIVLWMVKLNACDTWALYNSFWYDTEVIRKYSKFKHFLLVLFVCCLQ